MKNILKIILLMTGVTYMCSFCGCSYNLKYEKYSSKDAELNIVIDSISGWSAVEQTGSYGSFAQVVFYEPERNDKSLKAMMVLTVEKISKVKFEPLSIEGLVNNLLERRFKFKNTRVLSKKKRKILGTEALDLQLAYEALDRLEVINAKIIPIRERVVVFKKGDKFYTLRYENISEEFNKFNQAFLHIINTLRLKE